MGRDVNTYGENGLMRNRVVTAATLITAFVAGVTVAAPEPALAHSSTGTLISTSPTSNMSKRHNVVRSTLRTGPANTALYVAHSTTSLLKGESVRFVIRAATTRGTPIKKKKAKVQFRSGPAAKWKTVGYKLTSESGKVTLNYKPEKAGQYRIRVDKTTSHTSATSKPLTVDFSVKQRTLTERENVAKRSLGASKGALKTLSAKQARVQAAGAQAVSHRRFANGTVVSITKGSTTKTWTVLGAINTLFRASGGVSGKYGVPVADAKCGLLESGCVQRFTKGTIYSSSYRKKATGVLVTGRQGEIIAAATSQIGYHRGWRQSPVKHTTKYNQWAGSTWHWCAYFTNWAAAATGNAGLMPKHNRIAGYVKWAKKNLKVTRSKPRVGDLAFMDTMGAGRPTHVGIVTKVNGNTVTTVEGNTTRAFAKGQRGVSVSVRTKGAILFFATPKY